MTTKRMFKKVIVGIAMVCTVFLPGLSYSSNTYERFGLEIKSLGKVSAAQLDEIRGRYMGFFFSVAFTGFWNGAGAPVANLRYEAGFGKDKTKGQLNLTGSNSDKDKGNQADVGTITPVSSSGTTVAPSISTVSSDTSAAPSVSSVSSDASNSVGDNGKKSADIVSTGPNDEVKTMAFVGGLSGANGVFQISQVPGSMNMVYNGIQIRIGIFNIRGGSDANANLQSVLPFLLGF